MNILRYISAGRDDMNNFYMEFSPEDKELKITNEINDVTNSITLSIAPEELYLYVDHTEVSIGYNQHSIVYNTNHILTFKIEYIDTYIRYTVVDGSDNLVEVYSPELLEFMVAKVAELLM